MTKTLLLLSGVAFLAVPALHAQDGNGGGRTPSVRPQIAGAPSARPQIAGNRAARPSFSAANSRLLGGGRGVRSSSFGNYPRFSSERGWHGGHRGGGRYYYLGGVPYFYPSFGFGFGYPSYYYNGFYGYDGGYYGEPYPPGYYVEPGEPPYEGRIVQETAPGRNRSLSGAHSLPAAVQRQLAERGYYKGSIDGQFGSASKSALRRFQREHHLKETGLIDEASLNALGFRTDR